MSSSYREVAPEERRLRSLVAAVWAFSANRHLHRVLPDGCMDIVVLNQRARVVGTMQSAITIPAKSEATLGIRLRPGEADRLFPGLAADLTDGDALLSDLWGDAGRRLEDMLVALLDRSSSKSAHTILREGLPWVEQCLVDRLGAHSGAADVRTRAAAVMLAEGSTVADVAERVNLSERQLARRFAGRVGLSPKTFARVRRLQHAALLLKSGETLSSAAMLAGYADQPHFTREASALAGITPVTLATELTDGCDTSIPVAL